LNTFRSARGIAARTWTKREWAIAIRFYAAPHYIQAFLATKDACTSSHSETRKKIRGMRELEEIENEYNQLYNLGWNARYLTLHRQRVWLQTWTLCSARPCES
jgi:uncharacterized protein (UPF0332 family)